MDTRSLDSSCTRAERAGQTAAAAIAEIARRYGCEVRPREVIARGGLTSTPMEMLQLMQAARLCGFDVLPLEGGFDELPEVRRPNIVVFRGSGGAPDFMVLLEIDAESALIGDTIEGCVRRLPRAAFMLRWTGDAVEIVPDEARFAAFCREIGARRDPRVRLGLAPVTPKKSLFAASVVLVAIAVAAPEWRSAAEVIVRASVGIAAVLSLWLRLFGEACASCSVAARLVGGLPLASAGVALYGAVLAAMLSLDVAFASLLVVVLAGAAGAHAAFVAVLLRSPYRCVPCFTIAAAVLVALIATHGMTSVSPILTKFVFVAGFFAARWIAGFARRHLDLELRDGGLRLAARALAEPRGPGAGRVQMIVYKRKSCAGCTFYEAVVRGLLMDEFGGVLEIEERQVRAHQQVITPLFVVRGSADFVVDEVGADRMYERLRGVVAAALSPGAVGVRACGAVCLVRGG